MSVIVPFNKAWLNPSGFIDLLHPFNEAIGLKPYESGTFVYTVRHKSRSPVTDKERIDEELLKVHVHRDRIDQELSYQYTARITNDRIEVLQRDNDGGCRSQLQFLRVINLMEESNEPQWILADYVDRIKPKISVMPWAIGSLMESLARRLDNAWDLVGYQETGDLRAWTKRLGAYSSDIITVSVSHADKVAAPADLVALGRQISSFCRLTLAEREIERPTVDPMTWAQYATCGFTRAIREHYFETDEPKRAPKSFERLDRKESDQLYTVLSDYKKKLHEMARRLINEHNPQNGKKGSK